MPMAYTARKRHCLLMLHANHGSFIAYGSVSQCLYLLIFFSGNLSQQRSPYVKNCWACGRERRVARFAGTIKTSLQKWHILLGFIFYHPRNHMTKPDINRAGKYNFSTETASGSFQISRFLTSGGQSIGTSATASVLPWIFRVNFL